MIRWLLRTLRRPGYSAGTSGPNPDALFAELARARSGLAYDSEQRRRDFHSVFFGSDAGRRVLYEILAWSHIFGSTFVPGDSHATHWREGGRDIGLRVLAALNQEPRALTSGGGAAVETDNGKGVRS